MRAGITLFIVGAILAFAVRAESSWLDVQTVGVVLMLGGAAFAAYSRMRVRRREVVTREQERGDTGVEHTVVTERDR